MFSLVKSVFSTIQKEDTIKILIIGEGSTGKSSLFHLVSTYNKKSKHEIVHLEGIKNDADAHCALGFNTKTLYFQNQKLQIFDLEGTSSNTLDIYDCYYEDSDVLFYLIDSKSEHHIFKTISYLCYFYKQGLKDRKKKKTNPVHVVILGNKCEDSSSFFSAPCISNYLHHVNFYENEKIWNFFLSNENIYLPWFLKELQERARDVLTNPDVSLELLINKKSTIKKEEITAYLRNTSVFLTKIGNEEKELTAKDIKTNEVLTVLMKELIHEYIAFYKNEPVEVYTISVLKNRGVCEVLEKVCSDYQNQVWIHKIRELNPEPREKKDKSKVVPQFGNIETRRISKDEFQFTGKSKSNTNCRMKYTTNNKKLLRYSYSTPLCHCLSEQKYYFKNEQLRKKHERKLRPKSLETIKHNIKRNKEKYETWKNEEKYKRNTDGIYLFLEYMQFYYFGKSNYDELYTSYSFLRNEDTKGVHEIISKVNSNEETMIERKEIRREDNKNTEQEEKDKGIDECESGGNEEVKDEDNNEIGHYEENKVDSENNNKDTNCDEDIDSDKNEQNEKDLENEEDNGELNDEDAETNEDTERVEDTESNDTEESENDKTNYKDIENKEPIRNEESEESIEYDVETDETNEEKEYDEEQMLEEPIENKEIKREQESSDVPIVYRNDKEICMNIVIEDNNEASDINMKEMYMDNSISNLSSISLLDPNATIELAHQGEDSSKNVSKQISHNYFQMRQQDIFLNRVQTTEPKETKENNERKESDHNEQVEYVIEDDVGKESKMNSVESVQYFYNGNLSMANCSFYKEEDVKHIKEREMAWNKRKEQIKKEKKKKMKADPLYHKVDKIYKEKISKNRCILIRNEKKKRIRFEYSNKLRWYSDTSSDSIEYINVMNQMHIDSSTKP